MGNGHFRSKFDLIKSNRSGRDLNARHFFSVATNPQISSRLVWARCYSTKQIAEIYEPAVDSAFSTKS